MCVNATAAWIMARRRSHPEGAKPGDRQNSVSREVSALADDHVQPPPFRLGEMPVQYELEKLLQWTRRAVGAEIDSGFGSNDQNADQHRNPGTGQVAQAVTPARRRSRGQ